MNTDFNLKVLLKEIKRRWIFVLAFSLLIGCFFVYNYCSEIKRNEQATLYCSTCVIRINDPFVSEKEDEVVDTTDKNRFAIRGDATLIAIKELLGADSNITTEEIKNSLLIQGNHRGRIVDVFVVAKTQKATNSICNALITLVESGQIDFGVSADVIQHCEDKGYVRVTYVAESYNPNKTKFVINYLGAIETVTVIGVIKNLIFGTGIGFVIVVFILLLLCLIRNKVRYLDELQDAGYNVIAVDEKDQDNYGWQALAGDLLFHNTDDELVTIINVGCSNSVASCSELLKELSKDRIAVVEISEDAVMDKDSIKEITKKAAANKTVLIGKDIQTNPEFITLASYAVRAKLLIKKDTVSMRTVSKYAVMLGDKFDGIIFYE